MNAKIIYLDYGAATPLDRRVFKAMQPYFSKHFYNPSAPYQPARDVKAAIETARAQCGIILGARPAEIIFTAGATESVNLAFNGILKDGGHCVVSNIEHLAVLETARSYNHTLVKVDGKGRIILKNLTNSIRDDTVLVSIGMVNNEIGVLQDIKQIAAVLKTIRCERLARGNRTPLYFHTDATAAAGYQDLSVARLGVDLLSLGGNKIYGPAQTGLLFKSSRVALAPLVHGSGHEQNLRSGSENVAGIVGLGEALTISDRLRQSEMRRLAKLKGIFVKQLVDMLPGTVVIGDQKHSAPHVMMLAWPNVDGERLVFRLENKGVLVNTGAACAAKKDSYSHVLKALDVSPKLIAGSLRFSLGRETTENQLSRTAKIVKEAITKERGQ